MLKSIISFVMAFVIATVSIVGLNFDKFRAEAAQPKAVTQGVEADGIESQEASTVAEWIKIHGLFGFLWDDQDKCFYSAHEAWQRYFGYNRLYDFAAQFIVLYYDTCRVTFNYAGRDWLIQFWKGQYGFILVGAEVGIYYKDEDQWFPHYQCAEDDSLCNLGYTLYKDNEVLFIRTYKATWWSTGFVIGKLDSFANRSELAMQIRITLHDEDMRDKFVEALKRPGVGFKEGNAHDKDTFYILGNDIYIMWNTNRSRTT